MQIFSKQRLLVVLIASVLFSITSCKKPKTEYQYGVNNENLLPPNVNKTRLKTTDQYISILYANLFQKALSSNNIFAISQAFDSVGDQILARQLLIANLMKKPGVKIPTVTEMNADLNTFITDTYVRFYVRKPSEAEKEYLKQFITADPNVTPELVYMSFALSDEYMYY
ncbi:MAG: hypothetical protein IPM51_06395 [Sphingobacteriaceae bacterium]|nr:hypothetical protein [Sphingobacteriaceae bacterium]